MTEIAKMIDELGAINQKLVDFEDDIKRREYIKNKIKKAVDVSAEGAKFGVTITTTPYAYLDTKRIKDDHDEAWIAKYTTESVKKAVLVYKLKRKSVRLAAKK